MPGARPASLLCLLGVAACAGKTLRWQNDGVQDPAPSGPGYLRVYKESHFRALGGAFKRGLTMPDFRERIAAARVLFLGDHHADRKLHDKMLALLAELERAGRPYHLGLECIGTQDTDAVERFLAGQLDLDDLLHALRARWPDTWLERDGVDSAFYCELLRLARRCGSAMCT